MLLMMIIASLVAMIWRDRLELRRQQARQTVEIAREREISIRVEEEAHAQRRKAIAAEQDAMRLRQRTEWHANL
jgi:hypothetical protein